MYRATVQYSDQSPLRHNKMLQAFDVNEYEIVEHGINLIHPHHGRKLHLFNDDLISIHFYNYKTSERTVYTPGAGIAAAAAADGGPGGSPGGIR